MFGFTIISNKFVSILFNAEILRYIWNKPWIKAVCGILNYHYLRGITGEY